MQAYFDRLFAKHGMDRLKPASTPFPPGLVLSSAQSLKSDNDTFFMRDKPYAKIIGALQFSAAACCPDIAFATNVLSRFTGDPGRPHWNMLIHVLRYINGTRHLSIVYSADAPGGIIPSTYTDADFVACMDTH